MQKTYAIRKLIEWINNPWLVSGVICKFKTPLVEVLGTAPLRVKTEGQIFISVIRGSGQTNMGK